MAVQTLLQKEEALKGAQGLGYSSIDAVRKAILPASTNTFKLNIGDTIDSRLLSGNTTTLDAENVRRAKEQQQITQNESRLAFEQGLAGIRSKPESTDFISSLMFPQVTATTQARDELATQQRGLLQQAREFITGRTTDSAGRLAQLQEEGGVPALQERIAASNERVAQLQGELMKARPQIETEAGQTRIGAEARLAPVERNLRAEIASEALVQSALVGNLEAVQGNIDKILELEFQDEQAQLNDMMLSIQLVGEEINTLEPKLQEEANQRLAQFQFALQERASALQEAQTNKAGVLQILSQAAQNGAPESVLNAIKSAQTPEQALALTGGYMSDPLDRQIKQAQLDAAKLDAELTQTKITELNKQTIPQGIAYTENGEQITPTQPPKEPTVAEQQSLIFFSRMKEAVDNLDNVESGIRGLGVFGQAQLNYAPSILQTETQQLYTQASRQFTEARLRKDSGAAIPPEEFTNDRRMYFPQPGDSKKTLEQKRIARNTALSAIRQASGNAYWELYGESPTQVSRRIQSETNEYMSLIKNASPAQLSLLGLSNK